MFNYDCRRDYEIDLALDAMTDEEIAELNATAEKASVSYKEASAKGGKMKRILDIILFIFTFSGRIAKEAEAEGIINLKGQE